MARAKRKSEPKLKPSDYLGLLANYIEEIINAMGFEDDDDIVAQHQPEEFGAWLANERDFVNIPTNGDLKDKKAEEAHHILRQKALMLLTRFFNADCENDLRDVNEDNTLDDLLEKEEWVKAMDDFIEDEQYAFYSNEDAGSWRADDEEAEEEQVALDEAIASNAIAGVKEKIESDDDIPEEEFAIGVAEESGIEVPEIPADTDASVDSFIETITDDHVHGPDCEHSHDDERLIANLDARLEYDATKGGWHYPLDIPGSYLLWKWEIKAVIDKHRKAIDGEGHPVKALANGAKELTESGAVTTKGGLLDALLELIDAEPADALTIVRCFEKLK